MRKAKDPENGDASAVVNDTIPDKEADSSSRRREIRAQILARGVGGTDSDKVAFVMVPY